MKTGYILQHDFRAYKKVLLSGHHSIVVVTRTPGNKRGFVLIKYSYHYVIYANLPNIYQSAKQYIFAFAKCNFVHLYIILEYFIPFVSHLNKQ